jgi:hypothetical protein
MKVARWDMSRATEKLMGPRGRAGTIGATLMERNERAFPRAPRTPVITILFEELLPMEAPQRDPEITNIKVVTKKRVMITHVSKTKAT